MLAKLFPVICIWEYAEHHGIDKKYLAETSMASPPQTFK